MKTKVLFFWGLLCLFSCKPADVSIQPGEVVEMMIIGDIQQFTAAISPTGADNRVTWSVSDNNIGYISSTGLFRAIGVGTVDVIAVSAVNQSVSATVTVTITSFSLSITPSIVEMVELGDQIQLSVTISPEGADNRVSWSVSNDNGSITPSGLFMALRGGTVKVTATSTVDENVYSRVTINTVDPSTFQFGAAFGRKNYRYYHQRYNMMSSTAPEDPEGDLKKEISKTLKVHGWKNDVIHAKLVTWTFPTEGATVSVEKNDLTLEGGSATISASDIEFTALKYIFTNTKDNIAGDFAYYNESNVDYGAGATKLNYYADCLYTTAPVNVKANNFQPYWININVPENAIPGIYKGKIIVAFDTDGIVRRLELNMEVEVQNIAVPAPDDRKFILHTWTHPQATLHSYYGCYPDDKYDIALSGDYVGEHFCGTSSGAISTNGLLDSSGNYVSKLWTQEHFNYYRPVLEELYEAGQRNTFANLVKDPWPNGWGGHGRGAIQQTYYSFDDMVLWKLNNSDPSQGANWDIDLTHLINFIEFSLSCGLDEWIDLSGPGVWATNAGKRIFYYDVVDNYKYKILIANPSPNDTSVWKIAWTAFFDKFIPIAREKGWFSKIRISFDEAGIGGAAPVGSLLKQAKYSSDGGGSTYVQFAAAGNKVHNELGGTNCNGYQFFSYDFGESEGLRGWNVASSRAWATARRDHGSATFSGGNDSTFSSTVSTYPSHANNGLPAESQFFGWYAARLGLDGHLKWAIDSWSGPYEKTTRGNITAFPLLTADNKIFPAGDSSHIYPGDKGASPAFIRSSVRQELAKEGYIYYDKILKMKESYPASAGEINTLLETYAVRTSRALPVVGGTSSTDYRGRVQMFDFSDKVDELEKGFYEIVKKHVDN